VKFHRILPVLLAAAVLIAASGPETSTSNTQGVVARSAKSTRLSHMPGTPDCFLMASEQGDPARAASILFMRGSAGCAVPRHWHPSTENIMMVSGTARVQIREEAPLLLGPGDFMSVPPKHVMRFVCTRACELFVHTDGPFAVHYVDEKGNEITPAQALRRK